MNKSADPCEDFYNYACGLWATNYPVPENKLTWDINEQIRNNIAASLRSKFLMQINNMYVIY